MATERLVRGFIQAVAYPCIDCQGLGFRQGYAVGWPGVIAAEVCRTCAGRGFRVF